MKNQLHIVIIYFSFFVCYFDIKHKLRKDMRIHTPIKIEKTENARKEKKRIRNQTGRL